MCRNGQIKFADKSLKMTDLRVKAMNKFKLL